MLHRGLTALLVAAVALVAPAATLLTATATPVPYTVTEGSFVSTGPDAPSAILAYSFFVPDACTSSSPCPAILMTHGWGGHRGTVRHLAETYAASGYVVLTYDSRGWGQSTATITLDGPAEVRDARNLLDLLAGDPRVQRDGPGDPRVGMRGVSYAGGIQYLTAEADSRVDTIVPEITWFDLRNALFPNGVLKAGWVDLLLGSATGGQLTPAARAVPGGDRYPFGEGHPDPLLYQWYAEARTTGPSAATLQGLAERSASTRVDDLTIPVLLIQGWKDTLFTPNEAFTAHAALTARGVETSLLLYRWGHGYDSGSDPAYAGSHHDAALNARVHAWFDHHLKGIPYVAGGAPAPIEAVTPKGLVTLQGVEDLDRVTVGAAGGFNTRITNTGTGGSSAGVPQFQKTAGGSAIWDLPGATVALRVGVSDGETLVLGVPRATLTLSSPTPDVTLFVKLLAKQDGMVTVLGPQVQPVKTKLLPATDGYRSTVSFDLVGLTALLKDGDDVYLDIGTTDTWFAPNRDTTVVTIEHASLELPLVQGKLASVGPATAAAAHAAPPGEPEALA